jgi:hypothetical protein
MDWIKDETVLPEEEVEQTASARKCTGGLNPYLGTEFIV